MTLAMGCTSDSIGHHKGVPLPEPFNSPTKEEYDRRGAESAEVGREETAETERIPILLRGCLGVLGASAVVCGPKLGQLKDPVPLWPG